MTSSAQASSQFQSSAAPVADQRLRIDGYRAAGEYGCEIVELGFAARFLGCLGDGVSARLVKRREAHAVIGQYLRGQAWHYACGGRTTRRRGWSWRRRRRRGWRARDWSRRCRRRRDRSRGFRGHRCRRSHRRHCRGRVRLRRCIRDIRGHRQVGRQRGRHDHKAEPGYEQCFAKCPSGNILNPLNRFDSKEVI